MWAVTLCCAVFIALVAETETAAVPTSFGCRNSLLSDEWRALVLTFHNDKRRALASGDQENKDGTKLKPAKKMNELTWDCNLERDATVGAADCGTFDKPTLGVNQKIFPTATSCNISVETEKVLNDWWNEIKTTALPADLKYVAGLEDFANMAYWETNAFGCGTAKCSSGTNLLCIYNKLGKDSNTALYEEAASADVACDDCDQNTAPCVARLCQPAFTITADDPLLCADGSMTNDMTNTALYMHNYYRGLLGGGWAEDKISTYAPLAKAMPQLEYECAAIAKEASDRAKACKETPDDPTTSRSQNYLVIKDVNMDKEDALKQAISTWWKELADVGLGEDTTYKAAMKDTLGHFANMAYDQTKQVGCSVETCTKKGFTLVVCQYDQQISDGKKIYETGKSGDKACAGCATKKCGDLQGLCAP
ncbi:hypothetical protein RB195_017376 [Necator americanus]|uniref:SCP domain-containing protein n=1 Tax=Necator americanus TaxID=51031 RepID=A0ABR1C5Z2_NECAM